jgi:hypothetical protein
LFTFNLLLSTFDCGSFTRQRIGVYIRCEQGNFCRANLHTLSICGVRSLAIADIGILVLFIAAAEIMPIVVVCCQPPFCTVCASWFALLTPR